LKNKFYDFLKQFHNDENGTIAYRRIAMLVIEVLLFAFIIFWIRNIIITAQQWWNTFDVIK
jgi:hypothetical protein